MFTITDGKGFRIKFANGWSISVQWGPWNYCDNKDSDLRDTPAPLDRMFSCKDAEVAVIKPDGEFYKFENQNVFGWRT